MKKYIALALLVLLLILPSCSGKEVRIYIGTSENCEENTLIQKGKATEFQQGKIKIENGVLNFYRDGRNYDNLYLTFDGEYESISLESENAKILNTNLNNHSWYVDSFAVYKKFTEELLNNEFSDCRNGQGANGEVADFDTVKILKKLWDNGEFDEIRNVYFGGESSENVFLTGSEKNTSHNITGVFSSCNFHAEESGNIEISENSEVNYMGEKSKTSDTELICQWYLQNKLYEKNGAFDDGFNPDEIFSQHDMIEIKDTNSARWVYEMLYNKAAKCGKTSGCIAEDNIKINVKYSAFSSERYAINCKLFADGKITFEWIE